MGPSRKLLIAALILCGNLGASELPARALYFMQQGQVKNGIATYRTYIEEQGSHDFVLLREMAATLLARAVHSTEPDEQLLGVYGAGISADARLMPILEAGIYHPQPEIELAAVDLLGQAEDDRADALLLKAMASPYLLVRVEAGMHLARKRHPDAVTQLETLMAKVIPPIRPLFAQLFVMVGTPEADQVIRRMLVNTNGAMRRAAIFSLAGAGRDDFLPDIRRLATQLDTAQQEVCAAALGRFKDGDSVDILKRLTRVSDVNVRIAAHQALYNLGHEESGQALAAIAREENLYAIFALSEVEGYEETLVHLLNSDQVTVRVNAAVALLLHRDYRCVGALREILVQDYRQLLFTMQPSVAGALSAIKVLSPAHAKNEPALPEMSQRLREAMLIEATNLPEREFMALTRVIFKEQQIDLIPTAALCLQEMKGPATLSLLQAEAQHVGAPLIRGYCNLALYRAQVDGPYDQQLHDWLRGQWQNELIRLRPVVPWAKRASQTNSPYTLTPEESSRLLVESIQALAQRQETDAVELLLETLAEGNPRNRYALAGLLIRTIQ